MNIGILEFGTGCVSPLDIVENILEYAQQADELGYSRFWLGEHYGASSVYSNPEALLPIIAGLTNHIKVGAAGLLMAYHNPYRVAHTFKLLTNLFPNRIDLGVAGGRIPPEIGARLVPDLDLSIPAVKAAALAQNTIDLYQYLYAAEHAATIPPHGGYLPTIWSLSANLKNLSTLTEQKTALCKSLFHSPIIDHWRDAERLNEYRDEFFQRHHQLPEINLAFAGVCAETDQKARQIRSSLERPFSIHNELIGSPAYILDTLSTWQEMYNVKEFIFMNMAEQTRHKMKSLDLLAFLLPESV